MWIFLSTEILFIFITMLKCFITCHTEFNLNNSVSYFQWYMITGIKRHTLHYRIYKCKVTETDMFFILNCVYDQNILIQTDSNKHV